jgi:hypothetical protein
LYELLSHHQPDINELYINSNFCQDIYEQYQVFEGKKAILAGLSP